MNKNIITLDKTSIGDIVNVLKIDDNSLIKQRLQDLGIVKNSKIECVLKSPFKDPCAYLIKGCVIAIRNEDAKKILVEIKNE